VLALGVPGPSFLNELWGRGGGRKGCPSGPAYGRALTAAPPPRGPIQKGRPGTLPIQGAGTHDRMDGLR